MNRRDNIAHAVQRIDPVGWDKDGNTYFLFDGTSLFRRIKSRPRADLQIIAFGFSVYPHVPLHQLDLPRSPP